MRVVIPQLSLNETGNVVVQLLVCPPSSDRRRCALTVLLQASQYSCTELHVVSESLTYGSHERGQTPNTTPPMAA